MNKKTDLTKEHRAYYTATASPTLLEFGPTPYLSITGSGDPSGPAFAEAVQALYPVAYAVKFISKANGRDFVVAKLEGLWWFDGAYDGLTISEAPKRVPREAWRWQLLIRMPDTVTEKLTQQAVRQVSEKKGLPRINDVSFITLNEGRCIQILHKGPFDKEPETLQRIEEFAKAHSLQKNGHHHEIYLSDMRKTEPAKLKTILREPVA